VTGLPVALGVRAWRVRATRRGFRAHAQRLRTGLLRLPSALRGWRRGEPDPVPVASVAVARTAADEGRDRTDRTDAVNGRSDGFTDGTDGVNGRIDGVNGMDEAEAGAGLCDFLVQDRDPFQVAGEAAAPAIGDPRTPPEP